MLVPHLKPPIILLTYIDRHSLRKILYPQGAARTAEEEISADAGGPGAGVGAAVPSLLVLGGLQPRAEGSPEARPRLQGPDQVGYQGD
jgi:hypothetical protein